MGRLISIIEPANTAPTTGIHCSNRPVAKTGKFTSDRPQQGIETEAFLEQHRTGEAGLYGAPVHPAAW
ncbi:hypothetical protein X756_31110 [Mesorhizobium sp. LSHC412B00]|nr:hypothetical protein X756_31110 [Mesorhizobium sp. LSHC412B00]ESZ77699.1 hypothetical protein X726_11225 [Mesorhizobium sp. L103C105A0]